VFGEPSPLRGFEELAIANIDLPLKYFARYLKQAADSMPNPLDCSDGLIVKGLFAYHASVRGKRFEIDGSINPVAITGSTIVHSSDPKLVY
jgi:hypothetical protein